MDINVNKDTDFFEIVDNFAKTNHVPSYCIYKAKICQSSDITISIPTYMRIDTLEETLESALSQQNFDNYQICVFDNNPERADVTEIFMQRYKGGRVSYYKNAENLGMAGNWNRCISEPKSKWIVLLHDDDTITPDFLAVMYPYLNRLENIGILQSLKYRDRNNRPRGKHLHPYEIMSDLDFYNCNIIDVPSGIIYDREKVISLGGFNADYYPSLDMAFNAFMTNKYNTYVVNKYLTWYREGVGNASKAVETQKLWFVIDYFFHTFVLKRHKIPMFLVAPFAEYRGLNRALFDMKKWNTHFELPTGLLPWKNYSLIYGWIVHKLLFVYVRIMHNKQQCNLEQHRAIF